MSKKTKPDTSHVAQPHDRLVKKLLSNPETAKEILELYLPKEVLGLVDLKNLSLQRDSFIDDEHRAFAVDLLFKTTFQKEDGYLWILLEHQRNSDPWLPVRIFKYMATIWEHLRKTSKTHKIPLIYPLVIYNGARPYAHSLTLKDMIEPEASQHLFENFFKTPFCLIDLAAIQDDVLREKVQEHVKGIALLMTLKHAFNKNLQIYFEQILINIFQKLDQSGNRDEVIDLLYYLLNEGQFLDKNRFLRLLHQEFHPDIEGRVMTIAQQLRTEGKLEGWHEGKLEGKLEGTLEGKLEGELEGRIDIAKRLLARGTDAKTVAELTNLPLAKIEMLQKHILDTIVTS